MKPNLAYVLCMNKGINMYVFYYPLVGKMEIHIMVVNALLTVRIE